MKKELREKMLHLRKQMDEKTVEFLSTRIINNIKSKIQLSNYQTIGFYYPTRNEVDLRAIINECLVNHKKVVLPKVLDKTTMEFFEINSLEDVSLSSFKVYEPTSEEMVLKENIDLLFIPGVAFTESYYRLGYGGGYYDRYLCDYKGKKVGIAFEFQVIPHMDIHSYDIPMDEIITENPIKPYL